MVFFFIFVLRHSAYTYDHGTDLVLCLVYRYPIYRIPMGQTLKDLDACFLTYHSLSTPVGGRMDFPSF